MKSADWKWAAAQGSSAVTARILQRAEHAALASRRTTVLWVCFGRPRRLLGSITLSFNTTSALSFILLHIAPCTNPWLVLWFKKDKVTNVQFATVLLFNCEFLIKSMICDKSKDFTASCFLHWQYENDKPPGMSPIGFFNECFWSLVSLFSCWAAPCYKWAERADVEAGWNTPTLCQSRVSILAWLVLLMLTDDSNYYCFTFILIKSFQISRVSLPNLTWVQPELKFCWDPPPLLDLLAVTLWPLCCMILSCCRRKITIMKEPWRTFVFNPNQLSDTPQSPIMMAITLVLRPETTWLIFWHSPLTCNLK